MEVEVLVSATGAKSSEGSIVYCMVCSSSLMVDRPGCIEHHEDGSHTFTPKEETPDGAE